jgi:hypothetical protein
MQQRKLPVWLLAVICLGCLAGILWLCVTAGG